MSIGKKVAYNTVLQIVGRVIGLFIMLVTINYIANHLLVDGSALTGYGQYTIVFAYVSIIGVAADLGLFTYLVREITGKSKVEVGELIGSALGFRLLLMFAALAVAGILTLVLPYAPAVKSGIVVGVLVAFSLLYAQTIAAVFQAHLATDRIVITETIGRFVLMVATIWVLRQGYGLMAVVLAHLLGYTVTLLLSYWFVLPFCRVPLRFNVRLWRLALPQFGPIALITMLNLIHFKVDSVILSFYKPEAEVGIYGLAYKLIEIILIIPTIVATNLLPVMTSMHDSGRQQDFEAILKRAGVILFLIATPLTISVYALAPQLITFVSQPDFLAAQVPLRILIFAILFAFFGDLLTQALISARSQKKMLIAYSLAVPLNIVLNLLVIPRYSYVGAAVTTLVTEFALIAALVLIARQQIRFRFDGEALIRTACAGLATAIVVWYSQSWLLPTVSSFVTTGKFMQAVLLGIAGISLLAIFAAALWLTFGGSFGRVRSLLKL